MFPDRFAVAARDGRRGFALPLALFALTAVLMLVALVLDAAIQELRAARGNLAATRAMAGVESALAGVLTAPTDSVLLANAPGATRSSQSVTGTGDTVRVAIQRLGGRMVRATVTATSRSSGVRGGAGATAYLNIAADSTTPGGLRLRRLTGPWWAPIP